MARGFVLSSGMAFESEFGIANAVSLERRKVRVTFTKQPKAQYNQAIDDALNVANWSIIPRPDTLVADGNPAYTTVIITSVLIVEEDPLSVDICVDLDFSFDLKYQIDVNESVISADNTGGWIEEGTKTALFSPYNPSCRQKPVVKVRSWFGKAATKYDFTGDLEKFSGLLQDLLEQMKSLVDCFPEQFNPLYCREDFLDSRMRSLGNPFEFFTSEMTITEKRRVALQLIDIYRLKGTTEGIKVAIQNILGIVDVNVISFNENTWRIGESFEQLSIPFDGVLPNGTITEPFLGGGLYVPSGGPPGYPTDPIDPNLPENYEHTGTAFLGGSPQYTQAYLGGGDLLDDTMEVARIGKWNIAPSNDFIFLLNPVYIDDAPYLLNPAFQFTAYPTAENEEDIPIAIEEDRKGMYAYRIVLPSTFSPTDQELQRITTIAKYMQPANMHLIGIFGEVAGYTPVVLGTSRLGIDWILHA